MVTIPCPNCDGHRWQLNKDGSSGNCERCKGAGEVMGNRSEAQFWQRMTMRALCGCMSTDCRVHGPFAAWEAEEVYKVRSEYDKRIGG